MAQIGTTGQAVAIVTRISPSKQASKETEMHGQAVNHCYSEKSTIDLNKLLDVANCVLRAYYINKTERRSTCSRFMGTASVNKVGNGLTDFVLILEEVQDVVFAQMRSEFHTFIRSSSIFQVDYVSPGLI